MKTLAIVIGNNNYQANDKLTNAINDAQSLATVFKRLNYDVIERTDLNNEGSGNLLNEFSEKISQYDATIFFFAGHGFELDGENYLTNVECQIPPSNPYYARMNSIGMSELLKLYKNHPNKINILIVDACRKSFGRGGVNTFAPVKAPKGTLIAFSTSPEDGAFDTGHYPENSIYTGTLLKYIGREMLSVEELFKKVRKTVHYLSNGRQTPWEHTSLIDDFYFNDGQLVHSISIPYNEEVVKDANFQGKQDEISQWIREVRIIDWNRQNPAFNCLLTMNPISLDKNQQFILGRNLLQAGDAAYEAVGFFENINDNLSRYNDANGENHVLNGILFEIYFNNHGEFRKENFKMHNFEKIITLRNNPKYDKSFEFIKQLLKNYMEIRPFWIPEREAGPIDVNVNVTQHSSTDFLGRPLQFDIINSINAMSHELLEPLQRYHIIGYGEPALKNALANYLAAPIGLIEIHSSKPINNIAFPIKEELETSFDI
ncbi:caspase family protein [Sphingobacterium sp. MYb388]|uniref:caspase family protein n=1 Tax=Sphingobacterium sp. MYb388 TaxID=2745437 RepID=UPI0030B71F24